MKFFLDTYALVEITKGNKNYKKYVTAQLFTSLINLYELFFYLLKSYNENEAKEIYYKYISILTPIEHEHIFEASKIKLKVKNISYTDALGYAISLKESMKFLTGDKEFRDMPNVEFVK